MSAIAEIARPPSLYDIADTMAEAANPRLYDALMAVKPPDWTPNHWAVVANVNRNVFIDLRRRGNMKHDILEKLLDAAGVSFAQFDAGLAPIPTAGPPNAVPPTEGKAVADPWRAFRGHDRPRDVPVLGTPACGDVEMDGHHVETIEIDGVIDYVRRPQALDGRRDVYAIMPQGFSMVPKFEPGDIAYVEAKPPRIGDYAVVQLLGSEVIVEGESEVRIVSALLKRLVRQHADWVDLEQFNPPFTFRVDRARIGKIDRVIRLEELVSF